MCSTCWASIFTCACVNEPRNAGSNLQRLCVPLSFKICSSVDVLITNTASTVSHLATLPQAYTLSAGCLKILQQTSTEYKLSGWLKSKWLSSLLELEDLLHSPGLWYPPFNRIIIMCQLLKVYQLVSQKRKRKQAQNQHVRCHPACE